MARVHEPLLVRPERRTAIVTGASSGLGVTFAKALAEAGANVILSARRTDRLEALAPEIAGGGGNAPPLTCDVADADQVEATVATARERFGRVDIMWSTTRAPSSTDGPARSASRAPCSRRRCGSTCWASGTAARRRGRAYRPTAGAGPSSRSHRCSAPAPPTELPAGLPGDQGCRHQPEPHPGRLGRPGGAGERDRAWRRYLSRGTALCPYLRRHVLTPLQSALSELSARRNELGIRC
jgi:short subunit dehydrogenase